MKFKPKLTWVHVKLQAKHFTVNDRGETIHFDHFNSKSETPMYTNLNALLFLIIGLSLNIPFTCIPFF